MSRFLAVPKTAVWGTLLVLLAVASLPAQEAPAADEPSSDAPAPDDKFAMSLFTTLGNEVIDTVNYQYFGLLPDFSYGKWGVGLDLSFHFRFYEKAGGEFGFYPRPEDWWDSKLTTGQNVDKYLARLAYLRYGKKGDPLYAQLGWIPSTTLGTGFIVNGYNNGALRPNIRLTGLNLDASGSLIEVPYIGFESFVNNLSTFDLIGARASVKPFAPFSPESPILQETQVGFTVVADRNANINISGQGSADAVVVLGGDALAPLYQSDAFTSRATLDVTAEGSHIGSALGLDGTLVKVISWGAQARVLGENFIPNYIDQGYELSRANKYKVYKGLVSIPGTVGWQTSLGTSLLGDAFRLGFVLSGPFGSVSNKLAEPQLIGYAKLKQGLLPIDLDAFYLKQGLTSFGKLVSAEDALIGAKVGWTFGAVTLSVIYDLHYDPLASGKWITTSRIDVAAKMF